MLPSTCTEIMYCNKNSVISNGRYSRLTFICHYYHERISNIHAVFLRIVFAVECVLKFSKLSIMDQLNFIYIFTQIRLLRATSSLACDVSRDVASTTPLGNLGLCLTTLVGNTPTATSPLGTGNSPNHTREAQQSCRSKHWQDLCFDFLWEVSKLRQLAAGIRASWIINMKFFRTMTR